MRKKIFVRRSISRTLSLAFATCALFPAMMAVVPAAENPALQGATHLALLPAGPGNPRNSEGSFVHLKDGRLLFAYSRFSGNNGDDFGHASIVGRYSSDEGETWTAQDTPIVAGEGHMNVMSVSLLRLKDGRIAIFYGRKNSQSDLHFFVRFSSDEAVTWSPPVLCTSGDGYFVVNNDRAVQLHSGRIVLPAALHSSDDGKFNPRGQAMVFYSDDGGATWKRSATVLQLPSPDRNGLQEPGVVELKSGRLMMWIRTAMGSQYLSYSSDGGNTWSQPRPSNIYGPLGPASIKRIPSTGDLLLVWNDHTNIDPEFRAVAPAGGKRTPATVAISTDDGKTWIHHQNLASDPEGWYSYFAIYFVHHRVLLAFCSTGKGQLKLSSTDLYSFNIKSLY